MEANQKSTRTNSPVAPKHRRRLDHLPDMQEGVPFSMIPQVLIRVWLDKKFADSKFKLLCALLSHGTHFHVKRNYLENRFDARTVKKYCDELIAEGYIEKEKVPRTKGGYEIVYHVRSVWDWEIMKTDTGASQDRQYDTDEPIHPSHSADPVPAQGGPAQGGPAQELKKINPKKIKEKEIKKKKSIAPKKPEEKSPPASGRQKISKKKLVGLVSMLYGQYAKKTVMETLVDELEALLKEKEAPFPRELISEVARDYLQRSGAEDLEWNREHFQLWRKLVTEAMSRTVH